VVLIFATLKKLLTMLKRGHGVQGFPLSQRPLLNEMIKVGKCALRFTPGKLSFATFDIARFVF